MVHVWAVFDKDGRMRYIGQHEEESDCWEIFLGWPTWEEIKAKQAIGMVAERVTVNRLKK